MGLDGTGTNAKEQVRYWSRDRENEHKLAKGKVQCSVSKNCSHKVSVISKNGLEKKTTPRGHTDVLFKEDIILVGWKDNKVEKHTQLLTTLACFHHSEPLFSTMASNKYDASTTSSCRCFRRIEQKNLLVPIPTMVQQYNIGMGGVIPIGMRGVNLIDNTVACYRWESFPKQAVLLLNCFLCSSFL